jgi:hypothetical protein
MRRIALAVVVIAVSLALVPAIARAGENPFPIGKNLVPEAYRGDLLLPSGLSFGYSYMNDTMAISSFTFTLGGQPLPPGAIEVSSAKHNTAIELARFDTWVFPFLNVYGLAAVLNGHASDVAFKVNPVPGLPTLPIPSTIEPSYTGHFYGIGMTLAAGYKKCFASYDINRQWVTINLFDNTVPALTQGIRAGVHGRLHGAHTAAYVGGFHVSLKDEVLTGQNFIPGLPGGSFSLVASPRSPWNTLVGTKIEITRRLVVTAEAGFGTRKQFTIMPSVRF